MNDKRSSEYLSEVLDTTIIVSSAALMTITCFSSPLSAHEIALGYDLTSIEQGSWISNRRQSLEESIVALKDEKEFCDARAQYASRKASQVMTRDWSSYKEYTQESIRYKQKADQTQLKIDELINELEKIERE
ncbi:MAG: hypothetical protein QRY74_01490 [Chlamydia sp.]